MTNFFPALDVSVEVCIVLLSIVGNCFVMISVKRFEWLKSPTNYFVAFLAFFDFCNGLPFFIVTVVASSLEDSAVFRQSFRVSCHMVAVLAIFTGLGDLLCITVITVDRYIFINMPLRYHEIVTRTRALVLIASVFVFQIILSAASIRSNRVEIPCNSISVVSRAVAFFIVLPMFVITLVLVILLYSKIALLARKAKKSVGGIQVHNPSGTQNKTTKVMMLVIGVFMATYFTYVITYAVTGAMTGEHIHIVRRVVIWVWKVSHVRSAQQRQKMNLLRQKS